MHLRTLEWISQGRYMSRVTASAKMWICLYTCCVTRAIHLELVPDLTAQPSFGALNGLQALPVSSSQTMERLSRLPPRLLRRY